MEMKEFKTIKEAINFIDKEFNNFNPFIYDFDVKITFEYYKYVVYLNKFNWYEND